MKCPCKTPRKITRPQPLKSLIKISRTCIPGGLRQIRQTSRQCAIHDERIHESQVRMLKRPWQSADHGKAKAGPKPHSALVRTDHKIELHRPKTALLCALQR